MGVTYAGMLPAAEATGDKRFRDYAEKRLHLLPMRLAVKKPTAVLELGSKCLCETALPRALTTRER